MRFIVSSATVRDPIDLTKRLIGSALVCLCVKSHCISPTSLEICHISAKDNGSARCERVFFVMDAPPFKKDPLSIKAPKKQRKVATNQ